MKRLILLSVISALIAASCTKDIHLNLQNASGLIVIEGFITNDSGPYYVVISKTITFYDTNNLVPVTGAKVIMTDDAGNRDSLTSIYYPGLYLTQSIQGTVGRTYHLSVNVEGKQRRLRTSRT